MTNPRPEWSDLREARRRAGAQAVRIGGWSRVPEKYLLVDTETGEVWGYGYDDASIAAAIVGRSAASHLRGHLDADQLAALDDALGKAP